MKRFPQKKPWFRYVSAIVVLSALCTATLHAEPAVNTPPPSPIQVDEVKDLSLSATSEFTATIESKMHVDITAGVMGRVEWIAEPGTYVEQGQPLLKMDMLPLKLQYAEQKAQLKRAEINSNYLKNELDRLSKLRKTNAASQLQFDQTKSQYELAKADEEIATLRLKQVEDQISRATVRAPSKGVVTERLVWAGTDVNRGARLGRFLDTEQLEARVYVPVKYLAYVHLGTQLKISNDQQTLTSAVTAVIPTTDTRSQTFEIRLSIPNETNQYWASGQQVKVSVPVQQSKNQLTVHRDALILRNDGTYVVKVDKDNKAKRLLVTVGTGNKDRVSVLGDLAPGDLVAVRGAERLRDGQSVMIQDQGDKKST